jgi:hypothetical protein
VFPSTLLAPEILQSQQESIVLSRIMLKNTIDPFFVSTNDEEQVIQ